MREPKQKQFGPKHKSCGKKVKHGSLQEAKKHASDIQKQRRGKVGVYKCSYCGKYHVGHS